MSDDRKTVITWDLIILLCCEIMDTIWDPKHASIDGMMVTQEV